MKAIILAAGQGTRLRPLTNNKPKCLVKLAGKPMLAHQLSTLYSAGVDDIHVVGGYLAEQLKNFNVTLHINPYFDKTNMVTTLFSAAAVMDGSSDLIISYGDIVYEKNVIDTLVACDAPICLAVDREWRRYWSARMENPLADAETLKLDGGERVVEIGKRPMSYDDIEGQYCGLIKVRADHVVKLHEIWGAMDRGISYDGKDYDNMYMTSFLQYLIDIGWDISAAFINNGWAEVDCEADLSAALRFWNPTDF